jgi:hypothetical protein
MNKLKWGTITNGRKAQRIKNSIGNWFSGHVRCFIFGLGVSKLRRASDSMLTMLSTI